MRETSNYKLSQWDKTDRIEMEDFNSDNEKTDAALQGLVQQIALSGRRWTQLCKAWRDA